MEKSGLDRVLIVGITPYFLERGNFWFKENLQKILAARKTQSFFQDNTIFLENGCDFNLSRLFRQLDEMGYEIMQEVTEVRPPWKIGPLRFFKNITFWNMPRAIGYTCP